MILTKTNQSQKPNRTYSSVYEDPSERCYHISDTTVVQPQYVTPGCFGHMWSQASLKVCQAARQRQASGHTSVQCILGSGNTLREEYPPAQTHTPQQDWLGDNLHDRKTPASWQCYREPITLLTRATVPASAPGLMDPGVSLRAAKDGIPTHSWQLLGSKGRGQIQAGVLFHPLWECPTGSYKSPGDLLIS